jgi:hypothetical protein
MNNRTLVELNHDYLPSDNEAAQELGDALTRYMKSGDQQLLPACVSVIQTRHHSEPDLRRQLDATKQQIGELEGKLKKLAALAGGYAVEATTAKANAEAAERKLAAVRGLVEAYMPDVVHTICERAIAQIEQQPKGGQ